MDTPTVLLLVDLGLGKQRLGASAVAQVYNQLGNETPDVENANALKSFWNALHELRTIGNSRGAPVALAYHDRSDGGLFVTVAEMCFAGRCGVTLDLANIPGSGNVISSLFNEELGVVLQVATSDIEFTRAAFNKCGFPIEHLHVVGEVEKRSPGSPVSLRIRDLSGAVLYEASRAHLQSLWAETSFKMQRLRDNPACADSEFASIQDEDDTGLAAHLTFKPVSELPVGLEAKDVQIPLTVEQFTQLPPRPKVAVVREQGVNSYAEAAWAFYASGFFPVDVHMTDLITGRAALADDRDMVGAVFPGGFSYGDVLGAGAGWAKSALLNARARRDLAAFFARPDTFALGICNGCQMLAELRDLVPGAARWPRFVRNASEQFEARVCTVAISPAAAQASPVFFAGMEGARIPVAVAHGEGRAEFASDAAAAEADALGIAPLRYVDYAGRVALPDRYPANPNGSPLGIAGVVSEGGGRVLALMPHPERIVRGAANTWSLPDVPRVSGGQDPAVSLEQKESYYGGWIRLFRNARAWVEKVRQES
ncbi:hypothetical protein HK405_010671 [Cladochytrium tenue]|nr:hypothetical protein HK405_010671 [Cladochytrium tenue]